MIATAKQLLGKGIYTPGEAALYARVRVELLKRWVFGTGDGDAVFRSQVDPAEKTVTFVDLVQTMAVRSVRFDAIGVPLGRIREAVDLAQTRYGIDNPLCRKHVILVNPHTRQLFIELPTLDIVQATGEHKHSKMMRPIVESFLLDLEYDHDGIATAYRPMRDGNRAVIIDPERKFGEPFIEGCGYSVWTLYDSYAAEGSVENAASAYGIGDQDVRLAVRYVDSLLTAGDVSSANKP